MQKAMMSAFTRVCSFEIKEIYTRNISSDGKADCAIHPSICLTVNSPLHCITYFGFFTFLILKSEDLDCKDKPNSPPESFLFAISWEELEFQEKPFRVL